MDSSEKLKHFWQQQEATVSAMLLKSDADQIGEEEKTEIISYLPELKGKRILDLAAGIGRFTRHFSTNGKNVVSVDITSHFIEKNRQEHNDCLNVTFLCSNALDLQFKDQSFDFIFINWLLIFLEDPEMRLLLDRIYQWLSPCGELFIRESCEPTRKKGYIAHYRTFPSYELALKNHFTILNDGYIRTYVDHYADPMQCFWVCQKNGS